MKHILLKLTDKQKKKADVAKAMADGDMKWEDFFMSLIEGKEFRDPDQDE